MRNALEKHESLVKKRLSQQYDTRLLLESKFMLKGFAQRGIWGNCLS